MKTRNLESGLKLELKEITMALIPSSGIEKNADLFTVYRC